jgi:hypothetical protein
MSFTSRLNWSIHQKREPVSFLGLLRLWWVDFIIHPLFEAGEHCQDCGRSYVLWHASDELYQKVHGSLGGLLCPKCFSGQASRKGIHIKLEAIERN